MSFELLLHKPPQAKRISFSTKQYHTGTDSAKLFRKWRDTLAKSNISYINCNTHCDSFFGGTPNLFVLLTLSAMQMAIFGSAQSLQSQYAVGTLLMAKIAFRDKCCYCLQPPFKAVKEIPCRLQQVIKSWDLGFDRVIPIFNFGNQLRQTIVADIS